MKSGKINNKKLKSIAFDLDTKALQESYTKGDWHNAYNDIANFLAQCQFEHMQGSVYDSTTKFSDAELGEIIERMSKKLTWFAGCVKSIRGYDQPVMIDYTQQLKDHFTSQDLNLSKETNECTQKQINNMREQAKKASKNIKTKDDKDLDR